MNYSSYKTPFNVILGYIWTDKGLMEMSYYKDEKIFKQRLASAFSKLDNEPLRELEEILDKYFSGEYVSLDYPLDLSGTDFQLKVWGVVKEIPYGQVRSYKWVASRVGNPKAARAVGRAISRNPVVLVIPCHRVIKNDGSLGKYGNIDWLKEKLLKLEKAKIVLKDLQ